MPDTPNDDTRNAGPYPRPDDPAWLRAFDRATIAIVGNLPYIAAGLIFLLIAPPITLFVLTLINDLSYGLEVLLGTMACAADCSAAAGP